MRKVTLEGLPDAINEIIEEYQDDSVRSMHMAVQEVAQVGAKAVNSSAGVFGGKKYKRSWKVQSENTRLEAKATIYSTVPGLPHLLEKGHAKKRGGRTLGFTPGKAHIKPVEDTINKLLVKKVEQAL